MQTSAAVEKLLTAQSLYYDLTSPTFIKVETYPITPCLQPAYFSRSTQILAAKWTKDACHVAGFRPLSFRLSGNGVLRVVYFEFL